LSLIAEATKDKDKDVRENALFNLRFFSSNKAFKLILQKLRSQDPDVRIATIRGISNSWIDEADTTNLLIETLKDRGAGVRYAAFDELSQRNDITYLKTLIKAVNEETHQKTKRKMIVCFKSSFSENEQAKKMAPLWRVHKQKSKASRSSLNQKLLAKIQAAGQSKDPRQLQFIIKSLNHKEKIIRVASLKALSFLDGEDALNLIAQAVEDQSPEVRLTAFAQLAKHKNANIEFLLMSLSEEKDAANKQAMSTLLQKNFPKDPEVKKFFNGK